MVVITKHGNSNDVEETFVALGIEKISRESGNHREIDEERTKKGQS